MRKGSLKLLLSMALLAIGTTVYAASPVLSQLPIVVISDYENNTTQDWNLFVFTNAFAFDDYVSDPDTAAGNLKWTFMIGSGTGDLTINDVDPITDITDALNPTTPINGITTSSATFREVALSPGLSSDPITTPFATPAEITPLSGQATDINGDGVDDKLVGDLVITLLVADDQGTSQGLDMGNTFVWTYDTDMGTTHVSDMLLNQNLDFTTLPLDQGTDDPITSGSPDWYYRNWSTKAPGLNWLNDCLSGTVARASEFQIIGDGDPNKTGSIAGAAYGEWYAPGDATALLAPGKVYSVRAALGVSGAKTANDQPRIGIEENLVGNVNQTYSINAPRTFSTANGDAAALDGLASPFVPAVGSTMQYLTTFDPIDADVTNNSTLGDGNDLYYLFRFDFINIISAAELTASLTSFEVASVDTAAYNTNATPIARYGSAYNAFDDWTQIQGGSITLTGGGTILTSVTSATATAASVVIVTPNTNQLSTSVPEAFVEMSNANGTADIDDLEVVEGAAYRADYAIAMDGGDVAGVIPGNTYGIPALRLRTATPIPTFSIEYIVTPRNTNAFPTEGVASTLSMYWTASSQFASGTSANEENDAQMVFGVLDSEFTDGTCTLGSLRIYELNSDDPNVDY